jgi:hypothetical protein
MLPDAAEDILKKAIAEEGKFKARLIDRTEMNIKIYNNV